MELIQDTQAEQVVEELDAFVSPSLSDMLDALHNWLLSRIR